MNVLIADENNSVRYGLAVLLEELPQSRILGEAATFKDLLRLMMTTCPDMLLLSWDLPDQSGASLLSSVRLVCPDAYIVVLSSQLEAAEHACELGADEFISKTEPPERLLEVIRRFLSTDVNASHF